MIKHLFLSEFLNFLFFYKYSFKLSLIQLSKLSIRWIHSSLFQETTSVRRFLFQISNSLKFVPYIQLIIWFFFLDRYDQNRNIPVCIFKKYTCLYI